MITSTDIDPKLVDSFGRVHDYLRISLTEKCNLRCTYCMPAEGIPLRDKAHFMTREEIFRMAQTFVQLGVKKIRLTGGEPLVRKDAGEIIKDLGQLGIQLAITTNGILVDKFIETFKEAGIKSVNISLDSLNPERQAKISRRDYFKRTIDNINLLVDEGFHVKINMVVMKDVNDDELVNFVELTKDKPIHIRLIEFMPFSGNNWNWAKGIGFDQMMQAFDAHFGSRVVKIGEKPNDTAKCYKIEGYKGTFGIIASVTNPFCATCNRIRLTADGKIINCLFSSKEIDLLNPMRNGEDIVPLIVQSIAVKKAKLAGLDSLTQLKSVDEIDDKRSMIRIGG